MNRTPAALCRVDAGARRGLGHLQRCLSLAEALKRQGGDVVFLAPALREVRRRLDTTGCQFVPFDIDDSDAGHAADWTLAIDTARAHRCGLVIVDSYDAGDDYFAALREAGLTTIAIDDLAAHPFSAHLVVNGAAGAMTLPYRSSTDDTQFLLGPQYAILHAAFWDVPARSCASASGVRRILVSAGGADPRGVLPRMLRSVDTVAGPFSMIAVVGPFVDADDPQLTAGRYRHHIDFVHAPAHLRDVMMDADLAVSAGGQTLYELAATGTPAVAVQVFGNQSTNIRFLAAQGVVRIAGSVDDPDFSERLSCAVRSVIGDEAERTSMRCAGQTLVDGQGATRVAEAILESA